MYFAVFSSLSSSFTGRFLETSTLSSFALLSNAPGATFPIEDSFAFAFLSVSGVKTVPSAFLFLSSSSPRSFSSTSISLVPSIFIFFASLLTLLASSSSVIFLSTYSFTFFFALIAFSVPSNSFSTLRLQPSVCPCLVVPLRTDLHPGHPTVYPWISKSSLDMYTFLGTASCSSSLVLSL